MKSAEIQTLAPVGAMLCFVYLNWAERRPGRIWCSVTETGFAAPRGWPLIAVATANDDGVGEVHASVTQGDTHVVRNVRSGTYPHLAWSTSGIVIDLVVALSVVLATAWLSRAFVRRRRSIATRTDDPRARTGR